ncbi:MAG: FHA domain-containing protein [Deltaproteobacteria bacterium]|nr:FHA domain-containing protein [Deltaproteobacteria bacterium]
MKLNIIILNGTLKGKHRSFDVKNGLEVVFGRSLGDVHIPDTSISRRHCKIICKKDTFYLVDLKSSNKTWIDKNPVTEVTLTDGTIFRIGDTYIKVGWAGSQDGEDDDMAITLVDIPNLHKAEKPTRAGDSKILLPKRVEKTYLGSKMDEARRSGATRTPSADGLDDTSVSEDSVSQKTLPQKAPPDGFSDRKWYKKMRGAVLKIRDQIKQIKKQK